jgi:hypothetical protein
MSAGHTSHTPPVVAVLWLAGMAACSCAGQRGSLPDGGRDASPPPWTAANSYSVCTGLVSNAAWYQNQMTDCGAWFTEPGFDDGGYALGVDCALGAQDSGQPFVLLTVTSRGVDTLEQTYYFRTASGDSYIRAESSTIYAGVATTLCLGFSRGPGPNAPLLCVSGSDAGRQCCRGPPDAGCF